jgi:hypothetical protein
MYTIAEKTEMYASDCRANSNVCITLYSKLKCIYMIAERTQMYVEGYRENFTITIEGS